MRSRKLDVVQALTVATAAIFLLSEALGGVLRYYSQGSFAIAYGPKLALLLVICLACLHGRVSTESFVLAAILILSGLIGLQNGASAFGLGAGLFFLLPLIFGVVVGRAIDIAPLVRVFTALVVISAIGLVVDLSGQAPWKGYSYVVSGVEVTASREWQQFEKDRPAGFTRISTSLAIFFGVWFCLVWPELGRVKGLLVFVASFALTWATTYKTAAMAMLVAAIIGLLQKRQWRLLVCQALSLLTFSILVLAFSRGSYEYKENLLLSMNQRFVDSWPQFIEAIVARGGWLGGAGLGLIGSAAQFSSEFGTTVADNWLLYSWGLFGLLGVSVLLFYLFCLCRLCACRTPAQLSILMVGVYIAVIGLTSDAFENAVLAFFIGYILVNGRVSHRVVR